MKEGTIVCTCFGVTDKEIESAVRENNLVTVQDVTNFTKAGGGCGGCHEEIQKIIDRMHSTKHIEQPKQPPRLTTLQKIDRIRQSLEADVIPLLAQDGGNCELADVEGNTVYVRLTGHCAACAFSSMTLAQVIEKKLRQKVSDELRVELAKEDG
jgi:NifU-like protein